MLYELVVGGCGVPTASVAEVGKHLILLAF